MSTPSTLGNPTPHPKTNPFSRAKNATSCNLPQPPVTSTNAPAPNEPISAIRHLPSSILVLLLLLSPMAHAADFSQADALIQTAIENKNCPGAVLLVGNSRQTLHLKAYGHRALQPAPEAMTPDTIFDLASLTKPIACATSALILIDRGRLDPKKTVTHYLPEFKGHDKEKITVEQLFLHRSGLTPDNSIKDYKDGPEQAWKNICALNLRSPPGEKFAYSDVGFIVLGKLVEAVDQKRRTLDVFAREEIFLPLGMTRTTYKPPADWKPLIAPTEKRDGQWIRGQVHDPRAYLMGGVAGHAGLFGPAEDLAKYCRMLVKKGEYDNGKRLFSEKTWQLINTPQFLPDGTGTRSYGFDVKTPYSQPLGERFPPLKSFGHTGFTGTCFWIDPHDGLFFILLTNSVHPDGKGKVLTLRRQVSTAIAEAVLGPTPKPPPAPSTQHSGLSTQDSVLTGLDILKQSNFQPLANRKLAVITNHTGRDNAGNRTLDLLLKAPNVTVVSVLSPEHGLYGKLDEKVGHGIDEKTGLKVWSLYGETRRPTDAMLAGVDTILYDIQDIGTRFYTYPATLGNAMQEAAKRKIKVVVLDRPNPIAPMPPDGPIADRKDLGFTAFGPLPVVHGLTIGELARLFNTEYEINADLTVIECKNWNRNQWWDQAGLVWVNPSPNMRNLTQATIYPAVGLIEFTNVSVGRGTDQPFEFLGAPWIDGPALAAALNAADLPGLRFVPIEFTPTSSKYPNQLCKGVYILVTDRAKFQPTRTGLTIAFHLRRLFPNDYQIDNLAKLLKNAQVLEALKTTNDPATLPALWHKDLEGFKQTREKYLIYK